MAEDVADLFCELFDGVPAAELRRSGEAWITDPELAAVAAEVEAAALEGALVDDELRERVERGGAGIAFGALRGLDAALARANPVTGGVPPKPLEEHALRYAESGRLDSGAVPGALLPRFARPGRRGQLPDDLADAFAAAVRVRATDWEACDHLTLPVHARLSRIDREHGLRIAAAPMIRAPEELHWELHERSGMRFYRIHPADREPTGSRIARVIASWDDHDVTIGIAPELCLSPGLLERWQTELRGRERAATSRLRLVLAGSGNVERASPPANTAVLLDALTGEPLVRQRKIHPFNFMPDDLELWGLDDRFTGPIDEDLTRGEQICVIEAGGVRIAILVCEDLARLHALSGILHAHGVSLILVPVFARPTKDRRWERTRADAYGDATGSAVVVANSLVIASILGGPSPAGTAMAVASGSAAVGHASEPDDVVVFDLDGDAPRVVHERDGLSGRQLVHGRAGLLRAEIRAEPRHATPEPLAVVRLVGEPLVGDVHAAHPAHHLAAPSGAAGSCAHDPPPARATGALLGMRPHALPWHRVRVAREGEGRGRRRADDPRRVRRRQRAPLQARPPRAVPDTGSAVGQSFLTVILTHADARGVEQQLAYLGELAPASRFAVVHGGERSEFEKLGADALFVDDPHLRRYGEISLNRVVVSAHERWVAGDPDIELVYVLEYDLLVLRPDFEQTLAGLAKRTGAGLLGKAAGPRNDTNWPHYLSYRGNDSFNRFIEGVSRREDREVRLGCFGPGMLYSREAFDTVASAMGDAPPAFHELMLPTLVHHLGFPVVDVNELGDLYAGIRWKPPYTLEEALEAKRDGRTFVHPFKRMDQLGELAG